MSHQNNDERTDAEIMAFSTPMVTHFDHCVYCNQTYPTELGHQCQIRDDYQKWQREELARRHEERRKMVESLTPIVRHKALSRQTQNQVARYQKVFSSIGP